ncbi:hypothetical protein [Nitrosospira briensis]|uniref:hypothetical protein n=1 Tax=Nitrosospira briensis TaxID=35799 RepID=UPI00094224CB|nr:hypothetical protein [Nitrosospira briensis]
MGGFLNFSFVAPGRIAFKTIDENLSTGTGELVITVAGIAADVHEENRQPAIGIEAPGYAVTFN